MERTQERPGNGMIVACGSPVVNLSWENGKRSNAAELLWCAGGEKERKSMRQAEGEGVALV